MPKYDIEDLIDDLRTEVEAALPAKLTEIENEKIAKGKGVDGGLDAIESNAWYYQTWDDKILQFKAGIFYGVEDVTAVNIRSGGTAQEYKLFFEIVLSRTNQTNDISARIHRYSRALREILEAYTTKNSFISAIKVETVRPISFKLDLDTSDEVFVGGVSISAAIV